MQGHINPIEKEKFIMITTRANKITITTTETGYEAKFYRTHKLITTVLSQDTTWTADENANATTNRETFRNWVCDNAESFGIIWNPEKAKQAWERKYNTYMTDEEVKEDALTLVIPTLSRLIEKCRYNMELDGVTISDISARESTLSYVEDGKYSKSGAWCTADIEVTVYTRFHDIEVEILYSMEMKSGQICKPKTTIAEWNEIVSKELDLQGIELEENSDTKVA